MGSVQKRNHKSSHDLVEHMVNPFVTIKNEVDKAMHGFYDLFESKPFNLEKFEHITLAPLMDLAEDEHCFKIEVEMPGMDEKDIKVSLHENVLTIQGAKETSKKTNRKNYISREINYGQYARSITLPQSANGDKITACFSKGMLCITIPKKAGSKSHAHEIKINKA